MATCGIWSPSRKSTVTIKRTHFQPYLWRSVQRRLWFISNSERDAWIVVRNRLWHRSTGPVKTKSGFGPIILPSTGNQMLTFSSSAVPSQRRSESQYLVSAGGIQLRLRQSRRGRLSLGRGHGASRGWRGPGWPEPRHSPWYRMSWL